ncbi:MAG: transketolase C-terminal domain-containing protein [Minisyncoccia bacterium]
MLNKDAQLVSDPFSSKLLKQSTRDGFGKGTVEAGKADPQIVVLSADLKESTRAEWFQKEFPDRYIEMGVAEQNMATVAAGLAAVGKIPFITSYAAFSPGRNYEQIRTTIALNNVPVKICGMHAGVSVGPDGATHQMLEDMAMMRALPNMEVLNPCDAEEARKATMEAAKNGKPVYLRFGRSNVPVFTTLETPFEIGKARILWESEKPSVLIAGTGALSYNALLAARALDAEGVGSLVLHFGTVKPLDRDALQVAATKVRVVVTVEEHQIAGGFGSAVAETLSETHPIKVIRLGLRDEFGQSGDPDELIAHYGLSPSGIKEAVHHALLP